MNAINVYSLCYRYANYGVVSNMHIGMIRGIHNILYNGQNSLVFTPKCDILQIKIFKMIQKQQKIYIKN